MRKSRTIIALISLVIIVIDLFIIDYHQLISRSNLGAFLVIISSSLNIFAMILSNRHEVKAGNIQL
ncbi:MAG: hypothetical protein DRI73_10325 [Bacteroidetes bacterium]|nr:MAG: hypothetical protein DRI73_10325 [Bacteroidota bacterium]